MEPEKANKKPFFSFLAMIFAVVVFAAVASHFYKNSIGGIAPPVNIDEWITSRPPDLTGRVYVLEFWATWCPPCVQSIPHMIELANKYKDRGIPFIGISVDKHSEPAKKMVRDKGMNYHIGMDNGLSDKYSVSGIPSAFIIDRSGRIVWRGHPMSADFESALVNALNAPPPVETQTSTK